jgi:O-antigen ligase
MVNLFYILFAISFKIKTNFIGDLYLAQILIILISIYFLFKNSDHLKLFSYEKKILFLIILWVFNQIISDLVNQISFNNSARGTAKIIITYLSFYSFFKLAKLPNISIVKILLWICLINILYLFSGYNNYNFITGWKFSGGVSISISLIIFFNLYYKKYLTNNFLLILIFGIGILSLFFETRYLFLFNSLLVFYIILFEKFRINGIIPIVLSSLIFYFFMTNIYEIIIAYELLPGALLEKQLSQNSELGILLGGRGEIFSSYMAISDAPIIGHGSWAENCDYIYSIYDHKIQFNPNIKLDITRCLIKSHSVILGSWVNSGIFGFLFWFYIIITMFKKLIKIIRTRDNSIALFLYLFISLFWDIIFSPYGGIRMVYAPLCIVIVLMHNNQKLTYFKI